MSAGMLDTDIAEWRASVTSSGAVAPSDADEMENHLREQVAELAAAGLAEDEAFLVAVKRLGQMDQITEEFAHTHGDRLWKQLVLGDASAGEGRERSPLRMALFAAAAALLIQVPRLLSGGADPGAWFTRDVGLFALPVLIAYFIASRRPGVRRSLAVAAPVVVLAVGAIVFPIRIGSDSEALVAVHLPVALWFVAGAAYLGRDLRSSSKRMDFLRFSGEWAIYFVLIALGGAVLLGLTDLVLAPIAPGVPGVVFPWVLPGGAAAAVVVAAWLVEAKKGVIENIAPVLTAIFTPLFAVMLLVAAAFYAIAGIGQAFNRDLLAGFDALLLVVLSLVLYGLSARDPLGRAGVMDVLRLAAVTAALVLDLLVLASMLTRIGDAGLTLNRTAALGVNVLLVVDLAVTAGLSIGLLRGRVPALRLERWQTAYLPIFGAWAAFVVLVLPPLFHFA
jgi:hypothetical protein